MLWFTLRSLLCVVHAGNQEFVSVHGRLTGVNISYKVMTSMLQVKEEGWWLVLGDINTHELLALKRVSFADHTTARLTFPLVNGAGREMTGVTLFFVSDSYLGLDQQYFVPVLAKQIGHQQGRASQNGSQQQRRGRQSGSQLKNQERAIQASMKQTAACTTETPTSALGGQAGGGETADIASAVGQISLAETSNGTAEHDSSGLDQSASLKAKQQRPNARRRHP